MNNITYVIIEPLTDDSSSDISWTDIPLNKPLNINIVDNINTNEFIARQMDYDLNYNVKYLTQILEFYGFKKGKMNKKDIILKILEFETNANNLTIVDNRKRLFENLIELKNNSFFSKFIVGNFI